MPSPAWQAMAAQVDPPFTLINTASSNVPGPDPACTWMATRFGAGAAGPAGVAWACQRHHQLQPDAGDLGHGRPGAGARRVDLRGVSHRGLRELRAAAAQAGGRRLTSARLCGSGGRPWCARPSSRTMRRHRRCRDRARMGPAPARRRAKRPLTRGTRRRLPGTKAPAGGHDEARTERWVFRCQLQLPWSGAPGRAAGGSIRCGRRKPTGLTPSRPWPICRVTSR